MSHILVIFGSLIFGTKRLLRYLRFLQQEDYNALRFLKWIWKTRSFDTKGSLIALIASLLALKFPFFANFFGGSALTILGWIEEDPRKTGKLPLKMTSRAKRIFFVSLMIYSIIILIFAGFLSTHFLWLGQVMIFQMISIYLIIACRVLSKQEKRRQATYLKEARDIVKKVNPFIIGITGSYGKTSTKEALVQVLQIVLGPTFSPQQGVNTIMGITREIRTHLSREHHYAVIEMGAYKQGSIKELCELTLPQAAIITGVGTAHLERFGEVDIIRKAKGELAQAVCLDGILVCNGDSAGSRRIANEMRKKTTLLYGLDKHLGALDCWISHLETTLKGTYFQIEWEKKIFRGFTPLLGKSSLSNIAAVFTIACALGSQPDYVLAVIANLENVENRLQIQQEGDVVFLRDAYNSNPIGFVSALEVMEALAGNKRILMTPGIIELGKEQYAVNERIGNRAATSCDFALIVNEENRKALENGLRAGGMTNEQIFFCATRTEAFDKLNCLLRKGDLVLIENDLPDLYETKTKF
jgi:UDP-N-acetylmuramoyl-tripeptide--D-alanyl-D-alanine ligase